jgi:probable DNA metabolism protein
MTHSYPLKEISKAYRYDGSFAGFLSCVFEAYLKKEYPSAIFPEDAHGTLFPEKWIETDQEKARRVYLSLRKNISREAREQVRLGFLSCNPEKELLLFRFIRTGLEEGPAVMNRLADASIHELLKAVQQLQNESHQLLQFLRFSDYGGVLIATVEPKNRVLSLMAEHFCSRYSGERFLIWDKTHREALFHSPEKWEILPLLSFTPPPPGREEEEYRRLWKRFYDTVAIESRYNPRCRRSHMPMRYWKHMTEFQPENGSSPSEKGGECRPTEILVSVGNKPQLTDGEKDPIIRASLPASKREKPARSHPEEEKLHAEI